MQPYILPDFMTDISMPSERHPSPLLRRSIAQRAFPLLTSPIVYPRIAPTLSERIAFMPCKCSDASQGVTWTETGHAMYVSVVVCGTGLLGIWQDAWLCPAGL